MDLNNVIKVADFGLSVSIGDDKDYFRLSDTNEKLPVKWMAVESLVDYKFSEASDVVSRKINCDSKLQCCKANITWTFSFTFANIVVIWSDLLGDLQWWPEALSRGEEQGCS